MQDVKGTGEEEAESVIEMLLERIVRPVEQWIDQTVTRIRDAIAPIAEFLKSLSIRKHICR